MDKDDDGLSKMSNLFFKKMGQSRPLFRLYNAVDIKQMFHMKVYQ